MKITIVYNEDVVKQQVENDPLLQFRLNLLLTKEMKTENDSYQLIFEDQITNDVFRLSEYMNLLKNKN